MNEPLASAVMESDGVDLQTKIGDLFDLHQQRLYRLARRMAGDAEEARDLVQETFLRAAGRAASVPDEPARAEAWLVRVLVNLCRDRYRRRRVRGVTETLDADLDPAGIPTSAGADPTRSYLAASVVRSALASLPARQRGVIVLHELEERPVAEIARLLGIGAVTVRWHLSQGRRRLRKALAPAPGGRGGRT